MSFHCEKIVGGFAPSWLWLAAWEVCSDNESFHTVQN